MQKSRVRLRETTTQVGKPYTNIHKHRTSYFKFTLTFLCPATRWKSISADRKKWEIVVIVFITIGERAKRASHSHVCSIEIRNIYMDQCEI